MIKRVMEESIKTAEEHHAMLTGRRLGQSSYTQQLNQELIRYEPLNPDQRLRKDYEPLGLKNIGNSK
jgi:hypothetical protein